MGKSTASSCFKIIACGSDSVDQDELDAPSESKGSSDKRGWSFRKKSARHRVLSNTAVSETPSGNKDWAESANADLQTRSNSAIPEKASVIQWADEKPQFSTAEKPQVTVEEKPRVSAEEKPQILADEKPQFLADEKSQVSADDKSRVSADEKPRVSADEKSQVSADEKPQVSAEEKSQVSADEKPQVSTEGKSPVSEYERPLVSEDEKPYISSDEKPSVSSDEKPIVSSDEKPPVSALVDAKLSEPVTTRVNQDKADVTPDEGVVLVIQTAVRAFLARRTMLKHKNVTKLQAAVRGHLVRRHAVGTLRCVQAIVKMQALVRARHADRLAEKKGKDNPGRKVEVTYTSISKLLSNRFARQLLESSPRTKSINVKCDPSKSDSAWKWLERWMAAPSPGNQPSPQPELPEEQREKESNEHSTNLMESKVQLNSELADFRPDEDSSLSTVPSESDEHLITYDADSLELQASRPSLPPQPQNVDETNSGDESFCSIPTQLKESGVTETESYSFPAKTGGESEGTHSRKRVSLEPPEPESKKVLHGSKKASNPAFVAAQTKFEELTSAAKSTKVSSLPLHKSEDESSADTFSSTADHSFGARETAPSESSVPHSSRAQVGGSECGTEISVSSTLDSPDRSEVVANEFEQELKPSEDGTGRDTSNGHPHIEDDIINELSHSEFVQAAKKDPTDDANSEPIDVIVTSVPSNEEEKPENNSVNVQIEQEAKMDQLYKSPDASPRSHVTVPESQGTPSSQVSVNPKKIRSEKSGSNPKRRSAPAGKRSPSKPNHDSGTTPEQPKDHKNGKRRNSLGSAKAVHVDQEARDSNSSNSLPKYMQATESARAKAISNSSPRSSPDVHVKDEFIKKRHSLPGSNGRQGSPRIQRSLSNEKYGAAKANGTQSPQEKKWQR